MVQNTNIGGGRLHKIMMAEREDQAERKNAGGGFKRHTLKHGQGVGPDQQKKAKEGRVRERRQRKRGRETVPGGGLKKERKMG